MPGAAPRRRLAVLLLGLLVTETALAIGGALALDSGLAAARDSFLISNLVIAVPSGLCGALIAWHRPGNRLGWLLLVSGVLQALTPAVTPFLLNGMEHGDRSAGERWLSTVYSAAWPWAIGALLPLALLHFPDGRLSGRVPRWLPAVVLANGAVQVLMFSADANPLASVAGVADGWAASWLRTAAFGHVGVLIATNVVLGAEYLLAFGMLGMRYRRGTEAVRRQLLWLLWAVAVAAAILVVSRLIIPIGTTNFPVLLTAAIGLVPVSMAVAVLRHELLDIRLVWSRTVAYLALTAGALAAYLGLVAAAQAVLSADSGSALAALVVAALFNPARVRLQRWVDARLYGERGDPMRAVVSLVREMAASAGRPADVLPAIRTALRLPFAELCVHGQVVGTDGVEVQGSEMVPLLYRGDALGVLRLGVRRGESRLDPRDRAILELLAVPLSMAVHATMLSDTVQRARAHESTARLDERRRLRDDVHDGLGPLLTGIAFQTDAARNFAQRDAQRTCELLDGVRRQVTDALAEVRALLDQLRPVAVEDEGLVAALERHAHSLGRRPDGSALAVTITVDGPLPSLAPGVETAAYRIATEAVTNAARHTQATRVAVVLTQRENTLTLTIQDDSGSTGEWHPGVGLRSMRDRVADFGGTIEAGPTSSGGRVRARIPVGAAP